MKASTKKRFKNSIACTEAGKGRMRGRVGNANETEIKKKSMYTYKQKDLQHASAADLLKRAVFRAKETDWKMR